MTGIRARTSRPSRFSSTNTRVAVARRGEQSHGIAERPLAHAHLFSGAERTLALEVDEAILAFAGADVPR